MDQNDLNEAMGQRHAFHTSAVLGEQAAMAISLRAQLDVAHMAQASLQGELATTKGLLEAAEKQVADSGAEVERLAELNQAEQDRYGRLHDDYIAYVERNNSTRREARNAARRKSRA